MRLYNTLARATEPLKPLRDREVRMYVCGVTVYDLCHIGHARSAIVFDVLQRYLRARGYRVTFVKNFTDIDDKIINRANAEGVPAREISERYIEEFRLDMAAIGVAAADVEPKATDHIPEMVALIERLVARGVAYVVDGDVYFEVRRFPGYGKLSGKNLDDLVAGARVDVDERKRDPRDFALWKSSKPGEPSWPSPWGPGRPGWHIECSAMSMRYLDDPSDPRASFDIHGGGEDLVFPHHECEIAQSEAASGKPFVRTWVHNGFVNLAAEKMSKSLGNVLLIRELVKRYPPDALRLWLLNTHYRNPIEFSEERLAENGRALQRLTGVLETAWRRAADIGVRFGERDVVQLTAAAVEALVARVKEAELGRAVSVAVEQFTTAMDDDVNTPQARAALFTLAAQLADRSARIDAPTAATPASRTVVEDFVGAADILWHLARVLGLLEDLSFSGVPAEVARLVDERATARTSRDWKRADALRDEIQKHGWIVKDTPGGPQLTRAS